MWRLFQFPLCPFSRKVRLLLGEKGVGYELEPELPWERRDEFVDINPAGQTPVMIETQRDLRLIDSQAICEYFEETVAAAPMITGSAESRAEIRRLVAYFDQRLYAEAIAPLMRERMTRRLDRQSPDSGALRDAMRQVGAHLDYIDYLLDHNRRWIAGPALSLADLAAAAHISVADYLGGCAWADHQSARDWYAGLKSRPSFRPLLAERMPMVPPYVAHYDKVDF
ncbi:MAG: glutathione S-transferase family protein [Sphingomonadaceae bacterium]|nr:glutathione S-transferase family protein [Sphingomonadaceae bacterium]